ncbi:hypothetical protein O181_102316, partial [Austropuccinia psidii MF-1]|nr:hypothetical protein [Austropuccinia psidii MF-1]
MFWDQVIFSIAYHPQTDGLDTKTIQTSEDVIKTFCAYALEFKYSDCFTHYCHTLIPELELEHETSVHSSKGQTPPMFRKAGIQGSQQIHLARTEFTFILQLPDS